MTMTPSTNAETPQLEERRPSAQRRASAARQRRSLGALRVGLGLASRISPALGAAMAAQLFTAPPRFPRPRREQALLDQAEPLVLGEDFVAGWRWGEGPAVALVHGWAGRGAQLGALVPPLVGAGYSVLAFDAPAHGASKGRRTTVRGFSDPLLALQARFGSLHAVVAHSFGCLGAAVALQRGLCARGVVFLAPPANASGALGSFAAALALDASALDRLRRKLEGVTGHRLEDLDARHYGKSMTLPLLVVHDEDDRDVPLASGAAVTAHWPGARLLTTQGLGHYRLLRSDRIAAAVQEFVRTLPTDAPVERDLGRLLRLDQLRF
ncbi:MAG TPA: alpha/beta hydrolase [Polyangiaceae bacterium]|nr:alpha/beta hydrolase [Polyangiaceae bacterium]